MKTLSLLVLIVLIIGCGNSGSGITTPERICVLDSTGIEKCMIECTFIDSEEVFVCADKNVKLCITTPMVAYPTVCMEPKDCKVSKNGTFECNYLWENECFNQPCIGECEQCNPNNTDGRADLTCYRFGSGELQCLDWCGMYNKLQGQMWDEVCSGIGNACIFCRCWTRGMMLDTITQSCKEYDPRYLCWSEPGNSVFMQSQYNGLLRDKANGAVESWRQSCIDAEN